MNEVLSIQSAIDLPCWSGPVKAQPLDGGITNLNLIVEDGRKKYVVRLGEDIPEHGIMRWHELAVNRAAYSAGISPAIHHHEPGVLVIDYIESKSLTPNDLHDEKTLLAVTELLKKTHLILPEHMRGNVLSFWVFHVLRDYAATLRKLNSNHIDNLANLLEQAKFLEQTIGPIQLVLGHNDMLPSNVLNDGRKFWLIDWEYAGFNSPLFDLGGLATNCELGRDAERTMLNTYFGKQPDDELWRRYDAMKCASLLREAMWSMVSEKTSKLEFDYAAYTAENLEKYQYAFAHFRHKGSD